MRSWGYNIADGRQLTGEIAIGATPAVMALIGRSLIERVETTAPGVRPRLLEGYSGYLQNWVLTGVVDFALANGFESNNPLLAQKKLATEQLVAVAASLSRTPPATARHKLADLPTEAIDCDEAEHGGKCDHGEKQNIRVGALIE